MSASPATVGLPPQTPSKPDSSAQASTSEKRTPPSHLRSSVATSTAGQILNQHLFHLNAKDMEGKWLGPIAIDKFKKDFGPKSRNGHNLPTVNLFKDFDTTVKGEKAFVQSILDSGLLKGSDLWCKDTHNIFGRDVTTDADHALKFSPDVSFMGSDYLDMKARSEERLERLLGDILFFGDLKGSNSQDPCRYITSDADRALLGSVAVDGADSDLALLVRGQFACYARAICANSHRTHLHAFIILPEYARLLYFDRSGVAFSELFDWRNTTHLAEFILNFAQASALERGIDTSVTKVPRQDTLVQQAHKIFREAREANDVLPDEVTWESVFKSTKSEHTTYWLCNVYDEVSTTFHRVLTYRVHTSSPYFAGRATKGYIGVDIDEGIVAYMKRSWRIADDAFPKERDIYRLFDTPDKNGKSVPHLPGCYFGGDVPRDSDALSAHYFEWKSTAKPGETWTPPSSIEFFKTRMADYADAHQEYKDIRRGASALGRASLTDADIEMTSYILTVTLFKRIGSKLRNFKSTRQLCIAVRDAIETHDAAYHLWNVLHRDISEGNILIAKVKGKPGQVEGLLIDWDLCIELKKYTEARRKSRTGTWAFMSARMLEQPKGFAHEIFDDLESFCHVLHWHVLRFRHTTGLGPGKKGDLWAAMGRIFNPDETQLTAGAAADQKQNLLRGSIKPVTQARRTIHPREVQDIMVAFCKPFKLYYAQPPDAPTVFELDDPDFMVEYDKLVADHEADVDKGYKMCTHAYMRRVLTAHIDANESWVQDGPSQDQYPPHIRQAAAQDKDIDPFYRETATGVSISRPSEVAKAPSKRPFGDSDGTLFDSRFYSHGSGRTSGYTTEVTAASDTTDGARKKQRTA
ncbi:unnamed protein product [Peniophora sp. CBMAI 1063]|nr:unnamed protein product [Peniophora sp. CBMAI 1063]